LLAISQRFHVDALKETDFYTQGFAFGSTCEGETVGEGNGVGVD
jgi:hypothetical protein